MQFRLEVKWWNLCLDLWHAVRMPFEFLITIFSMLIATFKVLGQVDLFKKITRCLQRLSVSVFHGTSWSSALTKWTQWLFKLFVSLRKDCLFFTILSRKLIAFWWHAIVNCTFNEQEQTYRVCELWLYVETMCSLF